MPDRYVNELCVRRILPIGNLKVDFGHLLRPYESSLGFPDFLAVLLEEQSQGFADDLALAAVQSPLDHPVHSVQVQPA